MTNLVRASGIRGYREVMRALGADPAEWLRRYHIAPEALDQDDALIPAEAADQMLEASSVATDCPDLGLRMAQHQDLGILGPLGVVIRNEPTALEALRTASRYLFIHAAELELSIAERSPLIEETAEIAIGIRRRGRPAGRQVSDLTLASMHRMAWMLMGSLYRLQAITLRHAPLAPLTAYQRFFGVPVMTGQERAALHVSSATLRVPLPDVNPALRQLTEDYLARHFRIPGDRVSVRVRLALRRMLGTPRANKVDVAAMLAMHPRTMHRRLESEGTSFERIRDELRQEMALNYLRDTRLPNTQIAGILGFAQQAAFTRSCRRWFGKPPSVLRRESVPMPEAWP